jgi:hypothetical protein
MDAGGRHLTAEETKKLFSNAKMTGLMGQGYRIDFDMKADGTFEGYAYPPGGSVKVWGKWNVSDSGAYCQQLQYARGEPNNFCNSLYVVGGKYFIAGAGKNPQAASTARLYPRAFAPL